MPKDTKTRFTYYGVNYVVANDYAATGAFGVTKLATAPASSTNPIAVGDNDPRVDDFDFTREFLLMGG